MKLPAPRFLKFSIFKRYEFYASIFLLVILSVLSVYNSVRTNQEKVAADKTIAQKEILVQQLNTQVENLLKENSNIKSEDSKKQLEEISNVIEKYETIKEKTASYKALGVDVSTVEAQLPKVVDTILSGKYSEADALLTSLDGTLEASLKAKQVASAPKSSTGGCSVGSSGYCKTTIKASSGSFTVDVITANLGSVSVITDTANSDNCADACPAKSLASYIQDHGGFAGINGTYFCPPDYASCAGKVNSYDFPVYNTSLGKWLNQDKLAWTNRALLAFTSSSAVFYPQTNAFSGLSSLKAAISNFPGLVQNGSNIVGNYSLTSAQNTKGNRGGVGVKGSTIYLVIARSASVNDLANVMVALGVDHALNIDGGGSSALYYNGSYKVGPGRSLPNALILK